MASGRLKRKLEDIEHPDIDFSESFVVYGTALPSLTESKKKDKNEFVPVWQQEVRDEKGRRRLHGAFTGGFSAGYFNTVGSKEGWAPSTFKSSRTNKATFQQNVEDFMDEEDLEERRQAQGQNIRTAEAYDPLLGNTESQQAQASSSKFDSLVRPSSERIGEKLLTRMGWRSGQGIGPRISWAARKAQAAQLGYSLPDSAEDDEERNKHLWPPLDQPLVLFKQKNDHEGLGYSRGERLDAKYQSTQATISEKHENKKAPVGGAFGIGALEDADDDDLDIYQSSDQSDIRKHYSFHESDNKDPSNYSSKKSLSNPKSRSKDFQDSFNDGSPVIAGFRISTKIQQAPKWFDPPQIPKDWEPDPNRVFRLVIQIDQIKKTSDENTTEQGLNSEKRRQILGEEDIKGPRRSVFEYISSKDRERIEQAKTSLDSSKSASAGGIVIPSLAAETAKAALKGFVPYAEDPVKQNRYRLFLLSQIEGPDSEAAAQLRKPEIMSIEDFNSELDRFAEAAKMFSPLSMSMAKRFTRSTGTNAEAKTFEPGLSRPDSNKPEEEEEEDQEAKEREDEAEAAGKKKKLDEAATPAAKAARMDQFGFFTRTRTSFYPARLVCKRFNVPDPWPDGPPPANPLEPTLESANMGTTKEVLTNDTMNAILNDGDSKPFTKDQLSASDNNNKDNNNSRSKGDLSTVGLGEDDRQGQDVLTYERPAMDIFEAIFANSDDEGGGDNEKEGENGEEKGEAPTENISSIAEDDKGQYQDFQDPFPPARKNDEPVDTNTFKPVFASRRDKRKSIDADNDDVKDKTKKKKKKKDKDKDKEAKSKMSFAMDDEEESSSMPRKKNKPSQGADDDDYEWTEKRTSAIPAVHRARASDFL